MTPDRCRCAIRISDNDLCNRMLGSEGNRASPRRQEHGLSRLQHLAVKHHTMRQRHEDMTSPPVRRQLAGWRQHRPAARPTRHFARPASHFLTTPVCRSRTMRIGRRLARRSGLGSCGHPSTLCGHAFLAASREGVRLTQTALSVLSNGFPRSFASPMTERMTP